MKGETPEAAKAEANLHEIEVAKARAAELGRLSNTHAYLNPAEALVASAVRMEVALRAELGFAESEGLTERAEVARERLAKVLRDQGRVWESYVMDPKPSRKQAIQGIERPDDDFNCGCEDTIGETMGRKVRVSRWVRQKEVWSIKHNGPAVVWRCSKCPFINISQQSPPGFEEMAARRNALNDGVHDAQALPSAP